MGSYFSHEASVTPFSGQPCYKPKKNKIRYIRILLVVIVKIFGLLRVELLFISHKKASIRGRRASSQEHNHTFHLIPSCLLPLPPTIASYHCLLPSTMMKIFFILGIAAVCVLGSFGTRDALPSTDCRADKCYGSLQRSFHHNVTAIEEYCHTVKETSNAHTNHDSDRHGDDLSLDCGKGHEPDTHQIRAACQCNNSLKRRGIPKRHDCLRNAALETMRHYWAGDKMVAHFVGFCDYVFKMAGPPTWTHKLSNDTASKDYREIVKFGGHETVYAACHCLEIRCSTLWNYPRRDSEARCNHTWTDTVTYEFGAPGAHSNLPEQAHSNPNPPAREQESNVWRTFEERILATSYGFEM